MLTAQEPIQDVVEPMQKDMDTPMVDTGDVTGTFTTPTKETGALPTQADQQQPQSAQKSNNVPEVVAMKTLEDVYAAYPGRGDQITLLKNLLDPSLTTSPPSLYIYGGASSGKTSVIRSLLSILYPGSSSVYLNCIEHHTPRLLFEHALTSLSEETNSPSWENEFSSFAKCESLMDFVRYLGMICGNEMNGKFGKKKVMVFDRAERLRDMGATLVPALLRLSELSNTNITVIFISSIAFEKFRTPRTGFYEPMCIHFPVYTKPEALVILSRDCPKDEPLGFFMAFVELMFDVFCRITMDISELRYVIALLWPKFLEPVRLGKAKRMEVGKLYKFIAPECKELLDKLLLRELSSVDYQQRAGLLVKAGDEQNVEASTSTTSNATTTTTTMTTTTTTTTAKPTATALSAIPPKARVNTSLQLPHHTKYLLIASFLASYNPAKLDVRFFSRGSEDMTKTKRGKWRKGQHQAQTGKAKNRDKLRQQLIGPKPFPVERMLAIFYSISDDAIDSTVDIQMAISTLVTLKLLIRSSAYDRLEATKCKCNVSYDFAIKVASEVNFPLSKYLYDFQ